MSPVDGFRLIDSKPVNEVLMLSTEIQFSTDVAHLSTHPVYLYWSMSSNKGTEAYLGSWNLCSDNDTCDRSNSPEFEIKGNSTVSSVWLTSFQMLYPRLELLLLLNSNIALIFIATVLLKLFCSNLLHPLPTSLFSDWFDLCFRFQVYFDSAMHIFSTSRKIMLFTRKSSCYAIWCKPLLLRSYIC